MNIILKWLNFNLNFLNKYKNLFYKIILIIFFIFILFMFFKQYIYVYINLFFIIFKNNKFLLLEENFLLFNLNYLLENIISFFDGIINILISDYVAYIIFWKHELYTNFKNFFQENTIAIYFNHFYLIIYQHLNDFFKTSFLKYIEYISIISLQLFLLFLSIWTRACGPRVRLDQLSNLTWKELLITLIVILINIFLIMFFL